jgi:regulatory protein
VQEDASSSPNAKKEDTQGAEKAALRLIARAEQCTQGLRRKLERKGYSAACVDTVISDLLELKLIDDNRYARLWLESRLRFARTPKRLLASLCAKGIDRDDAEAALKTVLDEETEAALLARFVKRKKRDAAELKYLLKGEGFSPAAIRRFTAEQ